MKKRIDPFNKSGINKLDYVLRITHPELHPMYLSSLVDFLGKNMYQLPTQKNETDLLLTIRGISGLNLSNKTFIRAQRILTLSRKRRMQETSLFLAQNRNKKKTFIDKGR